MGSNHNNRRCFVLEFGNVDCQSAAAFGELTEVFGKKRRRESIWCDDFQQVSLPTAFNELQFDPERDFLVIAGNVAMSIIAVAQLIAKFGQITTLLWDASKGQYRPVTIGEC